MLTGKNKIYWIIRKLLGYVLWLEVVWLVINCISPWKLRSNADIIVVYTLYLGYCFSSLSAISSGGGRKMVMPL